MRGLVLVFLLVPTMALAQILTIPNTKGYLDGKMLGYNVDSELEVKSQPFIVLDNTQRYETSPHTCVNLDCRLAIPLAVKQAIEAKITSSTLEVRLRDANGVESPSVAEIIIPTYCIYIPPGKTIPETRPLGYAMEGFNSRPQAARIGQLREWGWAVEWQYDPTRDRVLLMAWCKGSSQ